MADPEDNLPKVTTPRIVDVANTQVEDLRLMLLDRFPDNYSVKTDDFFFSDIELMEALRRSVQAYNALPPVTIRARYNLVPDEYLLLIGAAWQACLSKLMYYRRKQTTYNSGSTQVDMYGAICSALQDAAQEFKAEFKELGLSIKRQQNIKRYMGRIG